MFSSVLLFLDHMIVVMKLEACKGQRCICSVLVTSCRISSRIMGRCWRCAARWFWWTGDVGFTAWGHFEDGYPLLTCLGFYKYEYMYLHCWLGVAWLLHDLGRSLMGELKLFCGFNAITWMVQLLLLKTSVRYCRVVSSLCDFCDGCTMIRSTVCSLENNWTCVCLVEISC